MQHIEPFFHMMKSESFLDCFTSDPVVLNMDLQHVIFPVNPYPDLIRLPMPDGIGNAFLYDPVDDIFLILVKSV